MLNKTCNDCIAYEKISTYCRLGYKNTKNGTMPTNKVPVEYCSKPITNQQFCNELLNLKLTLGS